MDLSEYKVGDWIPELGKYKKICALADCRRPFAGRKNKDHCSEFCKTKKNNDIARIRRSYSKRFNNETYQANNIFLKLLNDKEVVNEVSKTLLMKSGFFGDAPTKNIKDDRFHGRWQSVGSFGYRLKNGSEDIIEFIFIKDEELWQ